VSSALRSARRVRGQVAPIHDCATTPAARGTTPCAVTFAGDAARSFLPDELQLEVLFDGLTIGEGPVWVPPTAQLVVSDVAANKMYTWSESSGYEVLLEASGQTGAAPFFAGGVLGSNGAAVDAAGDIVFCQHGNRRLAKMSMGTANALSITSLVADADGKRFNSPNDLTIAPSGEVYFSDPPYGFLDLSNSDPNAGKMIFVAEGRELDKSGLYRFKPGTGELDLLSDVMELPNGMALSADGS
jgi:gluconolactonase